MNFTILCKTVPRGRLAKAKTLLVMKLTTLLLLAGCLQVSAAGIAQKVSMAQEHVPLKKVFTEIKKQTGYVFFYNARLLQKAGPVSIDVHNADLTDVLDACLKDLPLQYRIVNRTIVISEKPAPVVMQPPAQDTVPRPMLIKGRVIDDSTQLPVPGASVMLKGSKRGEQTDAKGEFSITAAPGTTITISFIGYESRNLVVSDGGFITVRLHLDINKDPLANVVITGYQQINKESFTGNAVSVTGEELKKVNPVNILQSLQSFDPSFRITENNILGSNPNRLPDINVRGTTSLPTGITDVLNRNNLASNVNLPTFILDGYEVSLEKVYDLDINRIQAVTLLKDAAATAIYGSRAANGVMVITTKTPRAGKLQLFYNTEANLFAPDLTGYDVLNAAEKLEYERLAGLYEPVGGRTRDMQEELYYQKMKNVVSGVNTYWLSQPVRTAVGQKHSLFVEGGTPAMRYGIDLRYQTQPGVMKGSYRNRYSMGLDLSYNPNNIFLFKNVLTVAQVDMKESPYGSFESYVKMNPYYPKTDSNGHIVQEVDRWLIDTRQSGANQYRQEVALNPLYNSTLSSFQRSSYLELIDAFSTEWNIAYGLRMRGLMSITKRKYTTDVFNSPFSNDFYFYSADKLDERGRYDYVATEDMAFDGNLTLSYNRQVNNHFFNATLGSNIRTFTNKSTGFTAIGFSNDRFTNVGFARSYPQDGSPSGYVAKERLFGVFLSSNYAYKNKYLLDLSIRADGSSKFGSDKRIAPFWALGIGWNLHKEDFLQGSVFSQLKARVSTGLTGAVKFEPYLSKTIYSYYSEWYSTGVGAGVNSYGNEELEWQRTRNYDAGLDIGLLKDRIVISPRYYYRLTKGVLADISLPPSSGFSAYKANLGDMENKGIELAIRYNLVKNKTWLVNLNANFSSNRNKILKVSNSLKAYNDKADELQGDPANQATPLLRFKEGQPINMIYAVRSLGIDPENGREIFIKRDGTHTYEWDVKDIVPVADPTPTADGFFGANIGYKKFMLQIQFYTRFGGQEYNQTLVDRVENADPRYNVDKRVLTQRWIKPGDNALYKNIADLGTTRISDRFVQKDNVLELNSLYLSYDFDKSFYSRLAMRNLRLAFTMNNTFRWSTMKIERGIDYPFARMFTFSLTTSF